MVMTELIVGHLNIPQFMITVSTDLASFHTVAIHDQFIKGNMETYNRTFDIS